MAQLDHEFLLYYMMNDIVSVLNLSYIDPHFTTLDFYRYVGYLMNLEIESKMKAVN